MAEEPIKPNPSPQEVEALKESVRKLEANNKALMEQYGKAMDKAKAIPDDVDVNALIAFKQQKEQEELEAKGRYEEAIAKQAQQFREAEAMQKQQIEKLMAEKRQFNIRISQNAYEKMEVLLKNATTNKCPTCGNETEIEFAKFKGLKPTSLASQLLEEMINELTIKPK